MSKLKCWKKVGERKGFVKFEKTTGRSKVILEQYPLGWDIHANKKGIEFSIKSKKEALRKSIKYMKNHDKC